MLLYTEQHILEPGDDWTVEGVVSHIGIELLYRPRTFYEDRTKEKKWNDTYLEAADDRGCFVATTNDKLPGKEQKIYHKNEYNLSSLPYKNVYFTINGEKFYLTENNKLEFSQLNENGIVIKYVVEEGVDEDKLENAFVTITYSKLEQQGGRY